MAFLQISTTRPDKHTDRKAWNASWEKDLEIWDSFRHTPPSLYLRDPNLQTASESTMAPLMTLFLDQLRSEILHLQGDIRERGVNALTMKDFATEWRALEPHKRKDFVLEALYKTSSSGPDMEDRRKWCPEANLDYMGQDGQSYLDLLTLLVASDAGKSKTTNVTFLAHPTVDQIFRQLTVVQGEFLVSKMRIDRTYYITLVIWNILLAFYSITELSRFQYMKAPAETMSEFRDAQRKAFPSAKEQAAYRRKKSDLREREKALGREAKYCWGCGKSQALLPADAFKICAGCKKIGRTIYYCSRTCQTNDWKNSIIQPHKVICGKSFEESSTTMIEMKKDQNANQQPDA